MSTFDLSPSKTPLRKPEIFPPMPQTRSNDFLRQVVANYKFLAKHLSADKSINLICYVGEKPVPDVVLLTAFSDSAVELLCQTGTTLESRIYTTIDKLYLEILIWEKKPEDPPPREIGFKAIMELQ
jgi:hypothetical protein